MTYDDLGGLGVPATYMDAIKQDCKVCQALAGEMCTDEKGRERHRPHGSRMVVRTGWSDENTGK